MSAYIIVDITVHDLERYQDYIAQVPKFVERHGGTYLVRGGNPETREGSWDPQRVVVLEFPNRAQALAFIEDPEYAPVAAIRHKVAHSELIIVDGA